MQEKITADDLFEKGLAMLQEDNPLGALAYFEKAYSLKKNPNVQSYLGFCIAAERGKITEAIELCNEAIAKEPHNPVHYLNLGRVYLKAERKTEAMEVLRKGLSFGDNAEIKLILESVGIRGKTVFPFLPRKNFLNKYVGLILHRFKLR